MDVEYAATASESVVRGAGDAGVVVTYHDGITEEKPGAESRRKILACVHVEKNGRREEYGALPGSLSEEAADSGLPAGTLQRRGSLSFRYLDHKTGETATETLTQRELVARLKQHIPEKFFKMVRYFGFLANRVCGEKLPQVYRALGMDKPEPVAKVCYAQMVKQFLSRDPFECVLCGSQMRFTGLKRGYRLAEQVLMHEPLARMRWCG
ncbi:IS1294 transposase [Shigella flexneri]|nr:IS1294 transposase [Shigella flexneri]